jgi:predicted nucleic acid-binding protein
LPDKGDLYISVITHAEVIAGMHSHEEAKTLSILDAFNTLTLDREIADQAGRWIYQYARRGIQLGLADVLIAATAFREGLTLATTNARHFPMPGLTVHAV